MAAPITDVDALQSAAAAEIEAEIRKQIGTEVSPAEIETIVLLVLKYGPSVYRAVLRLFHITPKS